METVITAMVLVVLALVTATGVLDFIFVNYGPGYENGKFKWWKKHVYKKFPSRIMLTVLLLAVAAILFAMEYLALSHVTATVLIVALAVACGVCSYWMLER